MEMINKEVCCQFCSYRKELYPEVPQICKECGFLKLRNEPYTVEVPVKTEDTNLED